MEQTTDAAFRYLGNDIKYKIVDTDDWHALVKRWIEAEEGHDVTVCDCCGNTEEWYGEPGIHDEHDYGRGGPYEYNGGYPECW